MHPTSKTRVALPAALLAALLFAIPAPAAETDPALAAIDAFIAEQDVDRSASNWKTRLTQPPQLTFTPGKTYVWRLETNHGPILVRFFPDVAPMHVSSAIYLTRLGFYDDTRFHRVIPGFMAQGGDPLGNGRGGPGYRFDLEVRNDVKHDKPGILSAANKGPGTDGSQFFLTFAPAPHLDGGYSIYGEVSAGMRVLKKFEERGGESGRPKEQLLLTKATIEVR
jgi:cyclophilin family peptidyl-prolyl cis-trans isomerase